MDKLTSVKAVLLCLFAFGNAVEDAKKNDGRFSFMDLLLLGGPLNLAPDAWVHSKTAGKDWANATQEDRDELIAWAKETFDLEDDRTEKDIEVGLRIAADISYFFRERKST